jgi:hypothetical protein
MVWMWRPVRLRRSGISLRMTAMELRPSEQPKSARPSVSAPSSNETPPIASSSQGITWSIADI